MTVRDDVTVFRAPRSSRIAAYVGIAVLAVLVTRVTVSFGWYATIGVLIAVGIMAQVWWSLLRPRLVASPSGIDIVSARKPVHIAWKDVQRCEVSPKGTLIVSRGGTETESKFPAGSRSKNPSDQETEADRAASFLAMCAAWGRRSAGDPMPVYQPPVPPSG